MAGIDTDLSLFKYNAKIDVNHFSSALVHHYVAPVSISFVSGLIVSSLAVEA